LKLSDMRTMVRRKARVLNANNITNQAINDYINEAYRLVVSQMSVNWRATLMRREDLVLTGVWTPIPEFIEELVEVWDATGVASTEEVTTRLTEVMPEDRHRTTTYGFTRVDRDIGLTGRSYSGVTLRLFYRPEPESLFLDNQEPRLIPRSKHDVLVWVAAKLAQEQINGKADGSVTENASLWLMMLEAGDERPAGLAY